MGLDGVELVLAVEDEFKIAIADADAVQCVTVGKLVDFVHSRLRQSATEPCPSQHGFYVVRRSLMDILGLERARIKPETRLEDLSAWPHRRGVWRRILASLAMQEAMCPPLVRPKWMSRLVVVAIPTVVCFGIVAFTWWPFVVALPASVVVGILGDRLTVPFKRDFPKGFTHVRDLVKFVKTLDSNTWSREDVFRRIRATTIEQLGVKESQVTMETNFVKDLGVG